MNILTRKYYNIILLMLFIFVTATFVNATMPTQQYNKIFLTPFYRVSMALNTNYTYNLSVNPPDGISKINSAIISFNLQANGQTQAYTLWVNGQSCNNPIYSIATAFSTTGQLQFYFDCSNIITKSGNYTITLRSDTNTGAVSGWLDLTYMNRPIGVLDVMGTEYSPGDPATMFVQLQDSYGNPVQNGSCYLDIWYPLNGSGVHPYTVQDAPMLQALGDDGLYYYDTTAPSQLGVYMLAAKCSYTLNWRWIYPEDELIYYPIPSRVTGTWLGGAQALNSKSDDLYERCDSTAVILCQSNYTFNVSQYGVIQNVTSVGLYFAGQGDVAGKTITFAYWNGTAFVNLPNIFTVVATGASATVPGDVDQFVSNTVPTTAIIGDKIIIRYTGQTGLARLYNNWLSIALLSSAGTIQDVKGSSEMHITNIANASLSLITAGLPQAVWNYTTRNLTYYNMTDTTNYSKISNLTALDVWTYITRNLTYYPSTTVDYVQVAANVWNYTTRNLTYYPTQQDLTNYTLINTGVWTYNGRNLTYYEDKTNYTLINAGVWTYVTRNLTYYPIQTDLTNYTQIAVNVWTYITRNLTYYENFSTPQTDLTNYSQINEGIWTYTVRNLTYYEDKTNYTAITDTVPSAVWTYITRNLTYYPPATVNTTEITENVWNWSARYTHGAILN